jgi:NTE family protein
MALKKRLLDGVFEGGGVKGIGLVGALEEIENAGYEFANVAGTSAGAIVATLVAAGYSAAELKPIVMDLNFHRFIDPSWVGQIPFAGVLIEELLHNGLYQGDFFENFMRDLLKAKGKQKFGDLLLDANRFPQDANDPQYRYKVQVVASDITRGRLLSLPGAIADYGQDPDELDIARAVRMSMSIPFFFMPVKLPCKQPQTGKEEKCYIVDGGLLSNFPVELFDIDGVPEWPTFGFKLVAADDGQPGSVVRHPIHGPLDELAAMFYTAMEAHDAYYLQAAKFARTIAIETGGVAATDFNLDQGAKDRLYESGRAAAQDFLSHWNFDAYIKLYRSGAPVASRRESVLPSAPSSNDG